MLRANWIRRVPFALFVSAWIGLVGLPMTAQQTPVDRLKDINRVSKELSEMPSESLSTDALRGRVTALLMAKRDVLRMRYDGFLVMIAAGAPISRGGDPAVEFTEIRNAHADWIRAELEITTNVVDRIKLLRENADSATKLERENTVLVEFNARGGSILNLTTAQAAKFDAELRLARELFAQPAKAWK